MTESANYRHEIKYPVTTAQLRMLETRLHRLIPLDRNAGERGGYQIRSLYFDDLYDSCLRENQEGTDPREKFRIRIYNHSADRITLECKRKERGKNLKSSCPLTLEQTRCLMAGRPLPDIGTQPPLLQKLSVQMLTRQLRPKVIVEYFRVPYVYPNGNVRITLDTNISSSREIARFLDSRIPTRPVMPLGQQLLEVKYDAYLPDFIYHSLSLGSLSPTAFSKYSLCRRYTK